MTRRLLARFSLRGRLLIALTGISALVFAVSSAILLPVVRGIGEKTLTRTATREARILAASVVEPLVLHDYTAVEELVRRALVGAEANRVQLSANGVQIEAQEAPPTLQRPAWFARLLGLRVAVGSEKVVVGGREYGTLRVQLAPGLVEDRIWGLFTLWFVLAATAVAAMALATAGILRANFSALETMRAAARHRAVDHLPARVELPPDAPPELAETAAALNDARDRLRDLFGQLAREEQRWRITLSALAEGVLALDRDGAVQFMNPVAERLTGWPLELARGKPVEAVMPLLHEESRAPQPNPGRAALQSRAAQAIPLHGLLLTREGRTLPVLGSAAVIPAAAATEEPFGAVLALRDDSERRRLLERLRRMAFQDPLTRLPNRRVLEERIDQALLELRQQPGAHVFCYIDLDRFKLVNDTCGHAAGDALLREIGALMRRTVRKARSGDADRSLLARIGGDEFGLLLCDCTLDQGTEVARCLLERLRTYSFRHMAHRFHIGASIGITSLEPEMTAALVLARADIACYHAKECGRGRVETHTPEQAAIRMLDAEMQWLAQFDQWLAAQRFRLYRQRIVSLAGSDAGPEHYEILLRSGDPHGDAHAPVSMLSALERFGYAPRLDRWVFDTLLDYLLRHPQDRAHYAINLSGATLSAPEFAAHVQARLAQTGLDAERLLFEITETAAIAHLPEAKRFIDTLKARGCRFCLDDFGSGLSSLAYLKELRVDVLKIEGAFMRGYGQDPTTTVIVQAIASLARQLPLDVVAEGVETKSTYEALAAAGVTHVQGWYVHVPEPLPASAASQP